MSKKYEKIQLFNIKRSLWLERALLLLHGLALIAAVFNSLPIGVKASIVIAVFFSLFYYRRQLHKTIVIKHSTHSGWEISSPKNTPFQEIRIIGSTILTPYVIILHYSLQNQQKQTILIARDALTDDEYRVLMVELKISWRVRENS